MTTVWGSAFEDFLTRDFDGGHNIVEDYLKRRGWKENASTRAYMVALRAFVGGDPILINERSATRSLKQWDRIVARCSGWLTCADQRGGVAIRTRCIGERFEVFAMLRSAPIRRSERLQSKLGRRQSSGHCRRFFAERGASRGSSGDD